MHLAKHGQLVLACRLGRPPPPPPRLLPPAPPTLLPLLLAPAAAPLAVPLLLLLLLCAVQQVAALAAAAPPILPPLIVAVTEHVAKKLLILLCTAWDRGRRRAVGTGRAARRVRAQQGDRGPLPGGAAKPRLAHPHATPQDPACAPVNARSSSISSSSKSEGISYS